MPSGLRMPKESTDRPSRDGSGGVDDGNFSRTVGEEPSGLPQSRPSAAADPVPRGEHFEEQQAASRLLSSQHFARQPPSMPKVQPQQAPEPPAGPPRRRAQERRQKPRIRYRLFNRQSSKNFKAQRMSKKMTQVTRKAPPIFGSVQELRPWEVVEMARSAVHPWGNHMSSCR